MSGGKYAIDSVPKDVKKIKTKYRAITTGIPAPGSLSYFTELSKYEARAMHGQLPILWDRAEGCQVFDGFGNSWIDFTSTIFVANAGHANPHIVRSLRKQLDKKMLHSYTFVNEARVRLLKKLITMMPKYLEKAFLLSAGTEATECAMKLMRMSGRNKDKSRCVIISFAGSMHGRTMGAEMLCGDAKKSDWIGYKDPNIWQLPFPYPWLARSKDYDWAAHFNSDMKRLKDKGLDFKKIAGFMIESYQGWGAIFYPKDYMRELVKFARKNGALVTFDEIQGGFGRTGKFFVYEHYDVEPDLICVGKGFSSSLPLSAVIGRAALLDLPETGSMSSTHSANPLCCAAALANLEIIEKDKLVAESARKGLVLHKRLNEIKKKFPDSISHILGKGLLAGIIITSGSKPDAVLASRIVERAMQKGLLLVYTGRESIKIGPPLTIPDDALLEGIDVLEESISEISSEVSK
ncbi:MAG: aspartate aminotransferase family protein [Candidatus Omnitrophica bacterium]|nr:aspartate aminotransferase family protein [Candidatus Omnitrophota bacterium]MDD5436307.1 aspartate aminotransferase family protein [Candidatus Omnitrophota bacterium]